MREARKLLAFVPQHTTTKSRIMAIVDRGDGMEIDAIGTVERAHEALALCNLLNAPDAPRDISGLWHSLDGALRASLERAEGQMVDERDERYMAPMFVHVIDEEEHPSATLRGMKDIDWARLFTPTDCPEQGCGSCTGCADGQCGPEGSCSCLEEDLDDCPCPCLKVGPRWAAVLYESLCGMAEILFEHAQELLWGADESVHFLPDSLIVQSPRFFLRLAQTCSTLAQLLARGHTPVPQTIAELIMLDAAACEGLTNRTGGAGNDELHIEDLQHLPEGHGDFEWDALWMFQFTDSDWEEIRDFDGKYAPGDVDRIFELLPEAAAFPRE
jgi:hypothetical protein